MTVQEIPIIDLHPWEDNPRMNDQAVDAVAESVSSFGFNVPILCDQNKVIIAGHTRWKAAKKLGMDTVPVIVIDMNDTQRRAFAIADNKTAEIADWNFPKLKDILLELKSEDIDLNSMGFSVEELRRLIFKENDDENLLPDPNDITNTKPGNLYELGRHRLLCGDSRNKESVLLLTEGCVIDHIFGGPPYFNQRAYSHWDDYQTYIQDMETIIKNCHAILKEGGVCVWKIANECNTHLNHISQHSKLLEESRFRYLDIIIWKKTGANYAIPRNFHIMRNSCYYPAFEWEALLVYQKPGDMPKMTRDGRDYMSKYQTDVWEISAVTRQVERIGHPAVCPVEIPFRSIQAYTGSHDSNIFEPFGGSGTTLIAAEKASRNAYVIEINPGYCDIIIKRWENLTGEKATLINA